jgi:hypothetical protein
MNGLLAWGHSKCSLGLERSWREDSYHDGRMSLSEAMFAKLLVTSLWQNLFWKSNALVLGAANLGRDLNCVRGVLSSFVGLEEKLLELVVG